VKKSYPDCTLPGYSIETTISEYKNYLKIGEAKRKGKEIN
jgi:hypothetical protein